MSRKTRLLIVEDEWLVAEDHASVLRDAGYAIIGPAPSVLVALRLIESEALDVAILDIGLNGETSYPVADRLIQKAVPFIFVTGYSPRDLQARLRDQRR